MWFILLELFPRSRLLSLFLLRLGLRLLGLFSTKVTVLVVVGVPEITLPPTTSIDVEVPTPVAHEAPSASTYLPLTSALSALVTAPELPKGTNCRCLGFCGFLVF